MNSTVENLRRFHHCRDHHALILLFGTGFIGYLPVPVLTAIVISALMDVVETHLAVRLFNVSRTEFYIFMLPVSVYSVSEPFMGLSLVSCSLS